MYKDQYIISYQIKEEYPSFIIKIEAENSFVMIEEDSSQKNHVIYISNQITRILCMRL